MAVHHGVIILTSFYDTHVNIGTSLRFGLLPIPWGQEEFERTVCNVVACGMQDTHKLAYPLIFEPLSSQEEAILRNGAGIQAWGRYRLESPEINLLLHELHGKRLPRRIRNKALRDLDALSYSTPPDVRMAWKGEADDKTLMDLFERELNLRLKEKIR